MGVAGTGMAAVAGLMKEAGYEVSGSDKEIYPPMSTMLEELGIEVKTPYSPKNLETFDGDLVIVANCLSRGHEEKESMMEKNIPYTSFPALLGDHFLEDRVSVVVSGTHGKTTTSSIMSYVLDYLGEKPGFLIGGIPRNFPRSFRVGEGKAFVLEGDEYDTAWFDKESKFLHYRPNHIIFNNLEFDHADIFDDMEAIESMFTKLLNLVEDKSTIIANVDDAGVASLCERLGILNEVTKVSTAGKNNSSQVVVKNLRASNENGKHLWHAEVQTDEFGLIKVKTSLSGQHNMANIAQVIGCLCSMKKSGHLVINFSSKEIEDAISSFEGVKRRLDHLGTVNDVEVYEDFAHHPTAVGHVIESFKKAAPERRLVVAFEPGNATSKRNVFQQQFAEKLSLADAVLIGKCPVDLRIPENERMDIHEVSKLIGDKAISFNENEELCDYLSKHSLKGDTIIFMSSRSFSGVQYKLLDQLNQN